MASLRTTNEYKHLMALFFKACGRNRTDRLRLASDLLGREVASFTDLDIDDINILIECFEDWERIQKVRLANGTLGIEALMVLDYLDGIRDTLADDSYLSTIQSRKGFVEMSRISPEELRASYSKPADLDSFMTKLESTTDSLKDTIITSPEVFDGRWPREMVINAPSVAMGLELGTGGIPRGRIVHLYGEKHSGKSQAAYQIGRMSQQQGIPVVLIDTEASLDADFAENLGLDTSMEHNLFRHIMPGNVEEVSEIVAALANEQCTIIIDSIASSVSIHEVERNKVDSSSRVGGVAKSWGDLFSIIRTRLFKSGATVILVNQVRSNLQAGLYGDPLRPWGGSAIEHQQDISFKITAAKEKANKLKGYNISRFHMKKNRFDDMTEKKFDLFFKPGYPYNDCIGLARICDKVIAVGSSTTYGILSKNTLLKDYMWDDQAGKLIQKKNRYTIRIDPYLYSAILYDDPDFEGDVDLEPLEGWAPPEDFDFYKIDVPDVDEENSVYYTIPRQYEVTLIRWLADHPVAMDVIVQRFLNGLNRKAEVLDEENASEFEGISVSKKRKRKHHEEEN